MRPPPPARTRQTLYLVAGRGRVGATLARALDAELVAARDLQLPPSELPVTLLLAVPEPAVRPLAERLAAQTAQAARRPPAGSAVLHVSGALPLGVLEAAREAGWAVGSFHPLRAFPRPLPPEALAGIHYAVDASTPELLQRLEDLARSLGGTPRRVPDGERTLYHAAAVLGANYLVALSGQASAALVAAGWPRDEALAALLPLMRGAIDDVAADGLPAALTGPIRRGDQATVLAHIAALEHATPTLARVYRIVGLAALDLAREAGLDAESAARIEEALTG